MAALTNPTTLASGGGGGFPRWAVVAFQNVTAGDTFDCSTLTNPSAFTTVTAGLFVSSSNRSETAALCTVASPSLTLNGTNVARDAGLLYILGE